MEHIKKQLEALYSKDKQNGYAPVRRPLRKYKGNLVKLDPTTGEYKYV